MRSTDIIPSEISKQDIILTSIIFAVFIFIGCIIGRHCARRELAFRILHSRKRHKKNSRDNNYVVELMELNPIVEAQLRANTNSEINSKVVVSTEAYENIIKEGKGSGVEYDGEEDEAMGMYV